ncbi:polysaccharide deacetylase family protein [Streptomyces sp. NPDC059398]|uniref:polysaccharide deacetylase family protein n=1 Tax=Streptomyces sp. NPDC059398 TaxID=3346820 RepID=UPI003694DE58
MQSPHLSSLSPEDALKASRSLVARRRGVPMLVSLRAAASPRNDPDGAHRSDAYRASASDAALAADFEHFHTRLAPGAGSGESAVIASLQALAYAHLGVGRPAPPSPATDAVTPVPLSDDHTVSAAGTAADLRTGHFLRVVNYHNTPPSWKDELVRELRGYAQDFASVGAGDLESFAETGAWHGERPGLLPVFYEGYRDNYAIAAAACDEAGVTGWFFVCTEFVDTLAEEQYDYALAHRIKLVDEDRRGQRTAMSWDEIADLHRRGHVVTPHTASHALARTTVTPADIAREVSEPKRLMDLATGGSAPATAWLEGTGFTGGNAADRALAEAGYRFVFGNTMVQRLPR